MAKPRVFISSTYYDLKHIRSSVESFVESLGYDSVLSEKSSIVYNPDIALDESCYKEAQNSDIFVIIIGGRYGSPSSDEGEVDKTNFYERYESVTRMEYENALKKEIPVYILIDKSVKSEYETFKNNRENESIKYAHVDSINIFLFIDKILNQNRNNPVKEFDKHIEIEQWLKLQWAGLFQELIRTRSNDKEIAELSNEISELSNINKTLKRYLEELVTSKEKGSDLIKEEELRLKETRQIAKIKEHSYYHILIPRDFKDVNEMVSIISGPKTFKELSKSYAKVVGDSDNGKRLLDYWNKTEEIKNGWNEIRDILELSPLK